MANQSELQVTQWLALARAPALGAACVRALVAGTVYPETLMTAGIAEFAAHGVSTRARDYLRSPDWKSVERDLRWLEKSHHHVLTPQTG